MEMFGFRCVIFVIFWLDSFVSGNGVSRQLIAFEEVICFSQKEMEYLSKRDKDSFSKVGESSKEGAFPKETTFNQTMPPFSISQKSPYSFSVQKIHW